MFFGTAKYTEDLTKVMQEEATGEEALRSEKKLVEFELFETWPINKDLDDKKGPHTAFHFSDDDDDFVAKSEDESSVVVKGDEEKTSVLNGRLKIVKKG